MITPATIASQPLIVEPPPDAPLRVRMTYEQFLREVPDGAHVEWAEGEAIIYVSASQRHQAWVVFLVKLLGLFVDYHNLGALLSAPFAARLWEDGPSREPDIAFIAKGSMDRLTEARMIGPVDLAIEVASLGTISIDRTDKFYEYQQSGVREYWLIDPRPGKERADFWVLRDDGRFDPALADAEGVFHSRVVPGFRFDTRWLTAPELPDALFVLAAMVGGADALVKRLRERVSERAV